MKILIRSRHVRTGARLRAYVARRLQFALGRFSTRVDRATVQLTDVNGPRGGEDKVCRIDVRLRRGGTVFVEETAEALAQAVAGAAERISRAVAKTIARNRDLDRAAAWAFALPARRG